MFSSLSTGLSFPLSRSGHWLYKYAIIVYNVIVQIKIHSTIAMGAPLGADMSTEDAPKRRAPDALEHGHKMAKKEEHSLRASFCLFDIHTHLNITANQITENRIATEAMSSNS